MVYRDTEETEGRMNVEDKRRRDERFVEAIRQNRAGMFRVARMMLRSDSDAEEAVADATESAYAHLHTLRNWEAVRPWLMRITVNACHKMLRRRKRETPSGDETLFDRPIKPSDATEIWSLVEQLDALYSVPLTMFYADGMKLEEIAAALLDPKAFAVGTQQLSLDDFTPKVLPDAAPAVQKLAAAGMPARQAAYEVKQEALQCLTRRM